MEQKEVKNKKILLICESPNKVLTLKQFLPSNFKVMASVGHISELNNSGLFNLGIDINNKFKGDYIISKDKKDIVKKLQEQVKLADIVYLASDPDREGEAISWYLKHFLKIPENKYKRITFHEITKKAVLNAIDNPRKIDEDLVAASQARQKLDKIVGYRLSPIAKIAIEAKSVGRCQSAGLKLIVEKEEEIQNFKTEKYFDLFVHFVKNNVEFKAKYVGTKDKEIKQIPTLDACKAIENSCINRDFNVANIDTKDIYDNPSAPFTTSSFQQEVSKKLGISVKKAMACAQKLFEGLSIGNNHTALITYIRTDSTEFAPEFLPILEDYIKTNYGIKYFSPIRKAKKAENAQEGHEAIRPVDLEMTPEKLAGYIEDPTLLKVYTIIYKRTIASAMAAAIISNTQYSIYNQEHKFVMNSREIRFDGYRKIYNYKDVEDKEKEEIVKEIFNVGEKLLNTSLERVAKETQPPKRYSESSFIKELDKKGIGRPSTFATILQTLLSEDRGYCKLENKFIVPTSKGIGLSHFLDKSFPDIININYTNELEKELDLIAKGKLTETKFLNEFYNKLEESINKVAPQASNKVICVCPVCGKGHIVERVAKQGYSKGKIFYACDQYPRCKTAYSKIEDIK